MPDPTDVSRQSALVQASAARLPIRSAQEESSGGPKYYDVPLLQKPVWRWEIASYFFLGGLSAGSYIISRLARHFISSDGGSLERTAAVIAATAVVPCAPLLIIDLGDPKRFHHMLRVVKLSSPMNLGAWALTGFSIAATCNAGAALLPGAGRQLAARTGARHYGPAAFAADAAGIPLALVMAGYTGVLLSATSTPIWCRSMWLGPLFSTSSLSAGTSAISLVIHGRRLLNGRTHRDAAAGKLKTVDAVLHMAEAATLAGYIKSAGELAKPLTQGRRKPMLAVAIGGMVAATILNEIPARGQTKNALKVASALCGLAGAFALRWAIVYAGHDSAADPAAARQVSKAK